MAQSCVFPSRIANYSSKKPKTGKIAGMEFSNIQDYSLKPAQELDGSDLRMKVTSMKAAIAAGTSSKVRAVQHLMQVNKLRLHEAVGLLQ